MTDLDDHMAGPTSHRRLISHLSHLAADAQLRPTPVDFIARRAARRRRGRRTIGAGAAAAVVVAAIGTAVALSSANPSIVPQDTSTVESGPTLPRSSTSETSAPPPSIDGPQPSTSAPTSPSPTELVPSAETWQASAIDPASAQIVDRIFPNLGMGSGRLTWTTDEQSPPDFVSQVFTSDDGVVWGAVPTAPGLAVLGGLESEERIDLVGYAPIGDPDAGAIVLATSTDQGVTWARQDLGYDVGPAWTSGVIHLRFAASQVVRRGDTVVATIEAWSMLDIDAIAGAGAMQQGYVIEDDGLAVLACEDDEAGCTMGAVPTVGDQQVDRRISWADAGLDEAERALLEPEPVVIRAEDGSSDPAFWTAGYVGGTRLAATAEGFLALVQTIEPAPRIGELAPASSLYFSSDGLTWRLIGRPPIQSGVVGVVADHFVASGPDLDTGSNIVVISSDAEQWEEISLPATEGRTFTFSPYGASVAHGRIALLEVGDQPLQTVRMAKNGVVVEAEGGGFGDMVVFDEASGEVLGGWTNDGGYSGNVRRGEGASFVVTSDAGDVIAEFTIDDSNRAAQEQAQLQEAVLNVIVSDDLVHWSRTSLNSLTDEPLVWAEVILATTEGWMIPAQVGQGDAPDRRVFIGEAT